jgi:hypothetical protein
LATSACRDFEVSELFSAGVKRRPDGDSEEEEEEEEEGASFGWHASEAVDIEDHGLKSKKKLVSNQWAEAVEETEKERAEEKGLEETVVIRIGGGGGRRGVYKCRLCPKILCLSEETMRAHLGSKVRSPTKVGNIGQISCLQKLKFQINGFLTSISTM